MDKNTESEATTGLSRIDRIKSNLGYFTGTEQYHPFNGMFRNFVMTDGVKYLVDETKCYWLLEIIASYHHKLKKEYFQVWKLVKDTDKNSAVVNCTDGDYKNLVKQKIPFTDFPLDEITLYCIESDGLWVIMLTSEY